MFAGCPGIYGSIPTDMFGLYVNDEIKSGNMIITSIDGLFAGDIYLTKSFNVGANITAETYIEDMAFAEYLSDYKYNRFFTTD
jgi:hypothetical protein